MNQIEYGKYISWLRKNMGLTQQELAEMVNCAWETISRIENGHELPSKKLFMEINRVCEEYGIIYDELDLDEVFEFRDARKELLIAIKRGRLEEIERALERFCKYMEDDKNSDKENSQYFVLAYLAMRRKSGMTVDEFLSELVKIFEIRRPMPKICDVSGIKLSQIEYEILLMIGEANILKGNREDGEMILKGLMANRMDKRSPFIKEKYMQISAILAKAYLIKEDYDTMHECLGYVFNVYINNNDTRTFFDSLAVQEEVCRTLGDEKGARLVGEFLTATGNLMRHMYGEYRIRTYM